jgi:hypothetical protein
MPGGYLKSALLEFRLADGMRRRWTFAKIGTLHGFAFESRAHRGIHHQFG